MEKELDNKKMWESLLKQMINGDHLLGYREVCSSLKDQGFAFNGEHIVPIENHGDQIGDYNHTKVFDALHANHKKE